MGTPMLSALLLLSAVVMVLFMSIAQHPVLVKQVTSSQQPRRVPNSHPFATTAPASAFPARIAMTPPMGYNTWNAFATHIDEDLIKRTADLMVSLGLVEAGYTYLNIDDAWHDMKRDPSTQVLKANRTRFPSGIPHLVQYAQQRGMKLGLYTDVGDFTCAGYPGSLGYEALDANTFTRWGISYLKVDNCHADHATVKERYKLMGAALHNASTAQGKQPMLYSLCSWGVGSPWRGWGRAVGGHAWRIDADIQPHWRDILRCADSAIGLSRFGGPGGWSDPDMLEVGNGNLTPGMQRAHFALWCVLKAPLLIGADLTRLAKPSLDILLSPELIAINQDSMGVPGDLIWAEGLLQVWAAPLAGGAKAVVVLNRQEVLEPNPPGLTLEWSLLGWSSAVQVTVRDLWAQKDLATNVANGFTVTVPSSDVVALRLTPDSASMRVDDGWRPWQGMLSHGTSLSQVGSHIQAAGSHSAKQQPA